MLPISHLYIIHFIKIKTIFQSFKFGKNLKMQTPSPCLKVVYILNCVLFDFFGLPPPPTLPFGPFPQFLAAMSSARRDIVTQFVCPFVFNLYFLEAIASLEVMSSLTHSQIYIYKTRINYFLFIYP